MVKFILIILLHVTLIAGVYSENCVVCHKDMPVKIDKFFYRYLLKYSSEENLKTALISYLKALFSPFFATIDIGGVGTKIQQKRKPYFKRDF